MSIAGGVDLAIGRARSIDCTAMQMFVKNNMQWFSRPLTRDEIRTFLEHQQRRELLSIFVARFSRVHCVETPTFHWRKMIRITGQIFP